MRKKMRKKAADEEMVDIDALEAAADAEAPSDHGSRRNARDQAAEAASARAEEMQKRRARCALLWSFKVTLGIARVQRLIALGMHCRPHG